MGLFGAFLSKRELVKLDKKLEMLGYDELIAGIDELTRQYLEGNDKDRDTCLRVLYVIQQVLSVCKHEYDRGE